VQPVASFGDAEGLVTDRLALHRTGRIARRLAFSALRAPDYSRRTVGGRTLSQFLAQRLAINLNELSAPAMLIRKFVLCVSVFLVTAIAGTVERRRIDSYGLPVEQAFGRLFWKGMLAGLLVVVFAAVAMILTGGMALQGLALHGNEIIKLGVIWFVANILVGVGEEYTFRGYALQSLWRGAGFWPGALITSAVFAGDHLEKPGENAMDIGMSFFSG
jgi:membrane protease YdiL (CAAX protease family)